MLIPAGVIIYTAHGGLKATYMSSYLHTIVIYVALCLFALEIYANPSTGMGSPAGVWQQRVGFALAPQTSAYAHL